LAKEEQRKRDGGFGFREAGLDCKEGLHPNVIINMHIYVENGELTA
jgi:hypothetical protein